jgi:hypothetical protein
MKLINLITPVSRIDNLPIIYHSILRSKINDINIKWCIVIDERVVPNNKINEYKDYFKKLNNNDIQIEYYSLLDINSRYGNSQRNFAFSKITDGWIYFLDDDTTLHPNLFKQIDSFLNEANDIIMFRQRRDKSEFPFVDVLIPDLDNIINNGIGTVDTGQIIYNYQILKGDGYYPIDFYQADGALIQRICNKVERHKVVIIPDVLCLYNSLRYKS